MSCIGESCLEFVKQDEVIHLCSECNNLMVRKDFFMNCKKKNDYFSKGYIGECSDYNEKALK